MNREPDWEALAEINFLIHRRMAEYLSDALKAVNQLNKPDPDGITRARAAMRIAEAQNLHTAWASLVRYKAGEPALKSSSHFEARPMLDWLASELQLQNVPMPENEIILAGSRETLQEALLLLRSCAFTLGPGVRLLVEGQQFGLWFRIQYRVAGKPPATLDELLLELRGNWRSQSASLELRSARDFLSMNHCELFYSVHDHLCELAFFVRLWANQATPVETVQEPAALLDTGEFETSETVISSRRRTKLVRVGKVRVPPNFKPVIAVDKKDDH